MWPCKERLCITQYKEIAVSCSSLDEVLINIDILIYKTEHESGGRDRQKKVKYLPNLQHIYTKVMRFSEWGILYYVQFLISYNWLCNILFNVCEYLQIRKINSTVWKMYFNLETIFKLSLQNVRWTHNADIRLPFRLRNHLTDSNEIWYWFPH
jgi:hypothetical protein